MAQETPVLRVNTRLVEVDVVVHSKGAAVADLKQDDFTVLDNGKPQKIAAFNVVSSRTLRRQSGPAPAGRRIEPAQSRATRSRRAQPSFCSTRSTPLRRIRAMRAQQLLSSTWARSNEATISRCTP